MSQEFSFRNLLSGFLRLSSRQTVSDPEVLARFIHQITGDEYQYVPPPQAGAAAAASVQTAVSTPTAPAPAAVAVREKSQEIDRQMISEISFSAPPTSSTSINTITVAHTTGRVTNSKIKAFSSSSNSSSNNNINNGKYNDDDNSPNEDANEKNLSISSDNDTESYVSCHSNQCDDDSMCLFDQDDKLRFPPTTCNYVVNDKTFQPSWSWNRYSHRGDTTYLKCLGIFRCREKGCEFICNAGVSNKERKKDHVPKCDVMCKNKKHVQPLIHLACKVMCRLVRTLNETQVIQTGRHRHPRPHELKASNVAKERLRQMVLVNSEAKPLQIKLGTPSRPPARSIHPSFGNLDRLAYLMKTFKQITSISDLLVMEKNLGVKFLHTFNLTDGVVVIQFPAMKTILQNNELYALQTDTIEGWIKDQEALKWNVHITSVNCNTIDRHVAVLLTLTKSRAAADYKFHFDCLLNCMEYKSFDDFLKKFPGNISDFSSAEQCGFKMSLIQLANNLGYEITDELIVMFMQLTFKFCEVSFLAFVSVFSYV